MVITPSLRVLMVKLAKAIQNKDYFMRTPTLKANKVYDRSKYCVYHRDTEKCCHKNNLIDKLIKVKKLMEFTRRSGKEIFETNKECEIHLARIIPSIFGGDREPSRWVSLKKLWSGEVISVTAAQTPITSIDSISFSDKDTFAINNPYAIKIFIEHYVKSILIDIKSSINIIFKFIFNKLGSISSQPAQTRGSLFDFSNKRRETKRVINLLVTWGEDERKFITIVDFIIMETT